MYISLIAAIGENKVIGINNKLPWHLSADLAWFKKQTLHKPIIMGRQTFDAIGRPLPGRKNIILSRRGIKESTDIVIASSIDEALAYANAAKEVMVIGGGKIYQQFMPYAHKMYLTQVAYSAEGDTYFPDYNIADWAVVSREQHNADTKNTHDYCFEILKKIT